MGVIQSTLTNLGHQLDDRTKTSDHPGVVTQAQSLFSSATSYVQSHLPTAHEVEQVKGTAVSEVARDGEDEKEITDALRELAQGGKATLDGAKGTVVGDVKHP